MQQINWFKGKDQLKERKLQLDENMQGNNCSSVIFLFKFSMRAIVLKIK
jgi:hypothetical protein